MIATILIWLYILALSFIYGVFCARLFRHGFQTPSGEEISISGVSMSGVCLIITMAGFFSLAMPLSLVANIIICLGAIAIAITHRKLLYQFVIDGIQGVKFGHPKPSEAQLSMLGRANGYSSRAKVNLSLPNLLIGLIFAGLFIFVLLKTTEPAHNYDTGLYHAQAIRWIETYRAVPGLGNLMYRLAINSTWLLPSALFSFTFVGLQSFHVMNGFFFLLAGVYFLNKTGRLLGREYTFSNLISPLLIFFSILLLNQQLSSPGTDLPATLLTWLIFLIALEKIESGASKSFDLKLILIFLLSSLDGIIKLSTAPVLLIPLFFLVKSYSGTHKARTILLLVMTGFVIAPWVIRNAILSGYLIFPLPAIDVLNPDWKIPISYVRENAAWIISYARLSNYEIESALSMPFTQWVPIWWEAQKLIDRGLLLFTGFASILIILMSIGQTISIKKVPQKVRQLAILYLAGWIGIIYWFTLAPDVRFGFGFIVFMLCLGIAPLAFELFTRLIANPKPVVLGLTLLLIFFQVYKIVQAEDVVPIKPRWLFPVAYPVVDLVEKPLDRISVYMPAQGYQCWYAPLPCTDLNNPEVHLRTQSLQDGFYNQLINPVQAPNP